MSTDINASRQYIGGKAEEREMDMVLDMSVICLGGNWIVPKHKVRRHTLPEFKAAREKTQNYLRLGLWTTVFTENHDQARSIPRYGSTDSKWREASGRVLAMLQATLSGTMFLYQGQEIGMMTLPEDCKIEDFQDVDALIYLKDLREKYPNDEAMLKQGVDALRRLGRDNARTPTQWSDAENAGFTVDSPWMRVNPNYKIINVAAQRKDLRSLLHFWRRLLALRREMPELLVYGNFALHDPQDEERFVFSKSSPNDDRRALVMLNFTAKQQNCTERFGSGEHVGWRQIMSALNIYGADDRDDDNVLKP